MRLLLWLSHIQKVLQLTGSRDIVFTLNMPCPPYTDLSWSFLKNLIVKNLMENPGSLFTYVSHLSHSATEHGRLWQMSDWACPVPGLYTYLLAQFWVGSMSLKGGQGMWAQWAKAIWGPLPILTWPAAYTGRQKHSFFVMRNFWAILNGFY